MIFKQPKIELRSTRHSSGFALLVVLFFVLAIGVAASFAVEIGAIEQRRSAEQILLVEGRSFQRAFQAYYDSTPPGFSQYPSRLEDLLLDPRYPDIRRYLRNIPPDPLTGKIDWIAVPALDGGILGVRSSWRGTPIKKKNFDPEFKSFEKADTYSDWIFSAYVNPVSNQSTSKLIFAPTSEPVQQNILNQGNDQ